MSARARPLFALFALASVLTAASAEADSTDADRARAKEAYARGVRAHDAGDLRAAAFAFAEADALAPSAVALMAALDAAVDADDPVLGADLLERSAREPPGPALSASIDAARAKLGGRAGRVRIACPASATCTSTLDDRTLTGDGPAWVSVGRHSVVVRVDGEPREHVVDVRAGETFVLSPMEAKQPAPAPESAPPGPAAPPRPAAPPQSGGEPSSTPRSGLSPIAFFVGAAVTVGFGAGAAVTGLLAKGKHDDFVAKRCDEGPAPGCTALQDAGEPLVVATNVLLAGAAVSAIATAVVGVAFTDWGAPSEARGGGGARGPSTTPRIAAAPLPAGGAVGSLSFRF
ncbi:MAG: hypothetical protein KF850_02155 [Labilithrix sp.]|nr:hypothetical protein [Labilithrix sp.]